jgi:hypothetical protein
MAFQSGVAAVDSTPHLALTWLVAVVLVACILLFLGMLSMEVWRSVQFARRVHAVRKASAASSPGGRASRPSRQYTDNPLKARRASGVAGTSTLATIAGLHAGAGTQRADGPPGAAASGQRGDASARVLTVARPPPPPPCRDEGPVGTSAGAAAAVLDQRSHHATRGLAAAAMAHESLKAGRDGRVKRLRDGTAGAPESSPAPPTQVTQPPQHELERSAAEVAGH